MPDIGIDFPFTQVRELADRCRDSLDQPAARQEIRRTVGDVLLRFVQEDFDLKSRGGTGVGGIRWSPLSPETAVRKRSRVIGVERGELERSARVVFGGLASDEMDVAVLFTAPHAEFFDRDRPLLPETTPATWDGEIGRVTGEWAEKVIQAEVDRD